MSRARLRAESEALALHVIAAALDKPSVFMGGPSQKSQRKAKEIIDQLKYYNIDLVISQENKD